jgi:hypothetical protein
MAGFPRAFAVYQTLGLLPNFKQAKRFCSDLRDDMRDRGLGRAHSVSAAIADQASEELVAWCEAEDARVANITPLAFGNAANVAPGPEYPLCSRHRVNALNAP